MSLNNSLKRSGKGFTLAELLISLAILGVIATFTIPKVLQASQDNQNKAVVKEMAAMFSQAYQMYQLNNTITTGTGFQNLTQYLNYVRLDTTSQIDHIYYTAGPLQCDNTLKCLRMTSGAVVMYSDGDTFGTNTTTQALRITIDPDGKVTQAGSPVSGQGKSTAIFIYMNGRLTTHGSCAAGTSSAWNATYFCPEPGADPLYIRNWD